MTTKTAGILSIVGLVITVATLAFVVVQHVKSKNDEEAARIANEEIEA